MMSSEEETEFGLYADKLLKKTKRTRQRVDAGEPRNSYSSIPNFSSRPSFLNTGNNLYGAIFTQQQHFGLFGPGFAPAKMLNELLAGRQKVSDGSAADGDDAMAKFDPVAMRCADGASPPSSEQLAHHMLRDILQGRKHELLVGQEHLINNNNNNNNNDTKAEVERGDVDSVNTMQECLADGDRQQSDLMEEALNGMDTDSLPSPKVEPQSPAKPEDAKKARVENIVSGMRSSPAPLQVNGCKKRKLYQPQQHDSTAERYIDDDDEETEPLRQKQVEKNALKSQLRTMQEQLAEMQQKYVQLCTRMEQNSDDSPDVEEIPSDSEQSKRSPPVSPARSSPTPTQQQQQPPPPPAPTLSQQVSKLKISSQTPHFHNGMLHDHQQLNNAAAMYLGVSHKFLLEQEARMAKEAAAASAAAVSEVPQSNPQPPTSKPDNIADRLNMIKSNVTPTGTDLEGLADALKTEITASLSNLIDTIVTRFIHQRKLKQNEIASVEQQIVKESSVAAMQLLDRKSPKSRVLERPQAPPPQSNNQMVNGNANFHPMIPAHCINSQPPKTNELHIRPPMFQQPKPPGINHMPLYGMNHPFCVAKQSENSEQNEALSLVVTPKKKRHKVTDTRITPRTVSRILGQDGMGMSPASMEPTPCTSPRPPPYPQPPPPMLPVSLPTSVAIPNPGLHESQVFSPYSPFFHGPSHGHHMAMQEGIFGSQASSSPPRMHKMERESPPIHHPPTLLHPALLAAAQHGGSPDYGHMRAPSGGMNMDNGDRNSDCNSGGDISYDGMQPTISFIYKNVSLTSEHSSTLTPMHLRKAKLMFFWVRYPSSAVLKMYFPDIKFNKNNTAQLVKWFSNFR
ncbi:homeobox protein prospero-like isoform X1 [Agrilus planipennis]|uniref:Homeobox protein prospero-like isoform X1 n=1 Tax=Agrilus planipennis TaxID=224129 RepID=A0A1W4WSD1_AGRPL|nr:homeobox protein prospero-like isoform X1 [Agrilus planipennis]XP_025835723.1 homeobox protein prospero-like isoform X1 [Agrilus planipennis]XP_025835724.1 homeobox protein prospero-like isoform X1 [Agrilus planipennis]